MQFRYKLQYKLVRLLRISNKEVKQLISNGNVRVNEITPLEDCIVTDTDDIYVNDQLIRKGKIYTYYKYHKPRGVECSMHPEIENSLQQVLQLPEHFYHIGRLDKDSEGLLLLSDDGSLGKKLLGKESGIEKVYEVETDKIITEDFLSFLSGGVEIMHKKTAPCEAIMVSDHCFEITLTEGMNRQIRRMCHKAGYKVLRLKRTCFAGIALNIPAGVLSELSSEEKNLLLSL